MNYRKFVLGSGAVYAGLILLCDMRAEACISVPVPIHVPPGATYGTEKPRLYHHQFGVTLILGDSTLFYNHIKRSWCSDQPKQCFENGLSNKGPSGPSRTRAITPRMLRK